MVVKYLVVFAGRITDLEKKESLKVLLASFLLCTLNKGFAM